MAPPGPPASEPPPLAPLAAVEAEAPFASTAEVAGAQLSGAPVDLTPTPFEPGLAPPAARRDGALVERASLAAFWNAAFLPLKMLARLVTSIVVVRVLGLANFGVLTQLSALLSILGLVSDLGVERALPRFIPEFEITGGRKGLSEMLRRVALIKALSMLPFVAALLLFPGFFIQRLHVSAADQRLLPDFGGGFDAGPVLLGMVAIMLLLGAASDVSIQVLYAYFRQKMTNALDVLNAILIPTLRAALVVPLGVFGALVALLLGTAISVVVSLRLMFRALAEERLGLRPLSPRNAVSAGGVSPRSVWRRFTAYSAMMYVITLSTALYDQPFVVLALGFLITDRASSRVEVALVALAFQFVRQLLQALVVPLTGVQASLFARLYAENRIDGLRTAYGSLTRFLILALVPAGAGLIVMTRNLLMLLYGQVRATSVLTTERLPETVAACVLLTIGLFGESLVGVALQVLLVYEEHRAVLVARLCALISIPLLYLLVPGWGVVGAAAAVAVAALGSRLVALAYGLRRLGLAFPTRFLGQVCLATAPFVVIIGPLALLLPEDPGRLLSLRWFAFALADGALILGGVGLFWLAFRRLGGLLPEDKQRFAGMRIPGVKRVLRFL
jgi:O-antigen/teichoic acid export membrane protein